MVVIVDYGVGNLGSLANMLKKAGARASISSDRDAIARADKLILPGVGAFDNGMRHLEASGLIPVLDERARTGTPLLGVCLGMQMLARRSEEGVLPGLGWIDAEVIRLRPGAVGGSPDGNGVLKVPHMGWNELLPLRQHPLLADLGEEPRFYFVHSYHVVCGSRDTELAHADYGGRFVAAVAQGNVLGVQFHPEKSHRFGTQLLRNFAERC
jgi:imidazole glycerol-phosphate synthase subunit HisH